MASSSKKAHRPPVKHGQPPVAIAPEALPTADISTAALQAAEVLPPVVQTHAPALVEIVEAPVAEAAPPAPFVAELEAAPIAEAPPPVETPAPVEAPAAAAVKPFDGDVRALFAKGLVESRAKFGLAKTVADEASAAVEASFGAAHEGVVAFNVKAIEAFKAGADANFDLFASLASAKTLAELVTLQSDFARKRLDEAASQAQALAELARKVADETVAPIKAHVAKTFKIAV